MEYTVILKYPEWATDGNDEYHASLLRATSAEDAIQQAKKEASSTINPDSPEDFSEDFSTVVVIEGWGANLVQLGE